MFLFTVYTALSLAQLSGQVFEAKPIYDRFKALHQAQAFKFPLKISSTNPNSQLNVLSSTFGPRLRVSCDYCYDFHRGVDLSASVNTEVYAVADGVVFNIVTYSDGGLTIVLKHSFGQSITYKGKTFSSYYSYYMHLDSVLSTLAKDQIVKKGKLIGFSGESGSAVYPHLHFELRVGTQCTLEYQLANPTSSCNYGFDPAMHSLLLLQPNYQAATIRLTTPFANASEAVYTITLNKNLALANRYQFSVYRIINKKQETTYLSHTLDLNERIGFDATSTTSIDTPDNSKPYLTPFTISGSTWKIQLKIPFSYIGRYYSSTYKKRLVIYDTWMNPTVYVV